MLGEEPARLPVADDVGRMAPRPLLEDRAEPCGELDERPLVGLDGWRAWVKKPGWVPTGVRCARANSLRYSTKGPPRASLTSLPANMIEGE